MRQKALSTVYELAKQDPRIVFIGSDLGAGTLKEMKEELPQQFFMEGISEQHVVGFAAGLAQEGFIPYINTIGTFLTRRSFEQVTIDIGLHNLPVRLLASGGGMVYAPLGPTHTAIDDFSLMLNVPNMKVFAPADSVEMENLLRTLVHDPYPHYIRFGKGGENIVTNDSIEFEMKPKVFGDHKSKVVIFTTGIMLQHCIIAREILSERGISVTIIHCPYLNVLSLERIIPVIESASTVLCVEEHVPRGGLFTQLVHECVKFRIPTSNLYQASLPGFFSHNYGSQVDHLEFNGLTGPKIAMSLVSLLEFNKSDL
jgi:transketolase